MKVMRTLIAICITTASFAPQAEVGLNFNSNIVPIVVDNEESGFWAFSKPTFEVPNGTNQIVLRVSKLVDNNSGEKEKFNSDPFVVMFDAEDTDITIAMDAKVTRLIHVEKFNEDPKIKLTDSNGNIVDFKIDKLPAILGLGRDYLKELEKYNEDNNIQIATATKQLAPAAQLSAGDASQMISYWSKKATPIELEQFTNWVFENRQSTQLPELEGSKALEMMGYWYGEASAVERKSILAWLVSQ